MSEVCTVCGGEIPHSTYKWLLNYRNDCPDDIFQKAVLFTYLFGEGHKSRVSAWEIATNGIHAEERIIPTKFYMWKYYTDNEYIKLYAICPLCALKNYHKCFNCGDVYMERPTEGTPYTHMEEFGDHIDWINYLPFCKKHNCNEMKEYTKTKRKYKGYTKILDSVRMSLHLNKFEEAKDLITAGLLEYNIEQSRKRA